MTEVTWTENETCVVKQEGSTLIVFPKVKPEPKTISFDEFMEAFNFFAEQAFPGIQLPKRGSK